MVVALAASACWTADNPFDPAACSVGCRTDEICYRGACTSRVAVDAADRRDAAADTPHAKDVAAEDANSTRDTSRDALSADALSADALPADAPPPDALVDSSQQDARIDAPKTGCTFDFCNRFSGGCSVGTACVQVGGGLTVCRPTAAQGQPCTAGACVLGSVCAIVPPDGIAKCHATCTKPSDCKSGQCPLISGAACGICL